MALLVLPGGTGRIITFRQDLANDPSQLHKCGKLGRLPEIVVSRIALSYLVIPRRIGRGYNDDGRLGTTLSRSETAQNGFATFSSQIQVEQKQVNPSRDGGTVNVFDDCDSLRAVRSYGQRTVEILAGECHADEVDVGGAVLRQENPIGSNFMHRR